MPAITGMEIARKVGSLLNVWLPGESVPPNEGALVLEAINDLLSSWSQRTNFIPVISRERFALVVGQGGPEARYTIGIGGDFDTERPSNQGSITAANLVLTSTTPEVRVPLGIYTDQSYDANQLPGMSNNQPTGLYYNPTYEDDLGSIYLWPVPTVAYNELELFLQKGVAQFADLTSTYFVPDGWPLALKYEVAWMLQEDLGRQMSERANKVRIAAVGTVKRSNVKLSDLMTDAYMFGVGRKTYYNINTNNGG